MKKWFVLIVFVLLLFGCNEKESLRKNLLPKGVTNVEWFQNDGSDYQLLLSDNGTISYFSPSAGNPYNNFDLCTHYRYNERNKTFLFNSDACTMSFIHISEDKTELELLVDGSKIFFKSKNQ